MKNFTLKTSTLIIVAFFSLFLNQTINAQVDIADYTFDSGLDGWIDGGNNAGFTTSNTFRCNAAGSIFVRRNGGSSIMTSPNLDLTPYSDVDFSFCFTSTGIDNNEGFDLQYFDGTAWVTLETYRRGVEFATSTSTPQTFTFTLNNATYNFNTNSAFRFIGQCSQNSEFAVFDDINIDGTPAVAGPEINVLGNTITILDGNTPTTSADFTNYGNVSIGNSITRTYTIQNTGTAALNIWSTFFTGVGSSDYLVTTPPTSLIAAGASTTFVVTFTPSIIGARNAILNINNDDVDEATYDFFIVGNGFIPGSCGMTTIHNATFESGLDGWTDGGNDANLVNNPAWSYGGDFSLRIRDADATGNSSSFLSPIFDFSSYDKVDFKFFFMPQSMESTHNAAGTKTSSEDFLIEYSSDGGTNWTIATTFESGIVAPNRTGDFDTSNTPIGYGRIVTLFATDYTFNSNSRFRVRCDASANDDLVYIDDITITATSFCVPTEAPGGVTFGLDLWLKADQVDGIAYAPDGSPVSQWADNGKGNNANTLVSGQEPVYRNSVARNFNFNPVIEFENDNNTSNADMTYVINDGSRQELQGTGGYNSNDIFVVLMPDPTITTSMIPLDTFTSSDPNALQYAEDVTGFGYGAYTARFTNERLTYCIGTTSETPTNPTENGYGRADNNSGNDYNKIQIINIRQNASDTDMELYFNANQVGSESNDLSRYAIINNARFWLGRSQYWNGSFDGRMAEVITYNSRKSDVNLTQERNRIQSYLAIKYGITLGINGVSQDYVNSDGDVIWDQSADLAEYNYDIAGIGRDDVSELNQKQSSSINDAIDGASLPIEGIVTMGLTDIYNTNSDNINSNVNTFGDKQYLVWGNNNESLDAAPNIISVDMSAGIPGLSTPVSFIGMQRVWKVVETGGDIGTVKVSIPQNAIRNISPPGSYLMFISDTPIFDPTADYKVMTADGSGNLEADYNFNATKFITFGYAPQVVVERSIYFDGAVDYIDVEDNLDLNPTEFTLSSWIKRDVGTTNTSILSKRNFTDTEGYDLGINGVGRLVFSLNGGAATLTSSVVIPESEWHQVAVIYDNGTTTLYIDGVADTTASSLPNPIATSQKFLIAAADGFDPNTTAYFAGNIDEVRVWDIALSIEQLRFIMNQEILDNTALVNGKIIPNTITKNEIASIPWSDLAGYYPMSIYTYTNTNDESENNHQGALRNLNTVDFQTAPLPYQTTQSGSSWDSPATWKDGSVQTIPGASSIVDSNITVDWNIVNIGHDISLDNSFLPAVNNENITVLGLIIQDTPAFTHPTDFVQDEPAYNGELTVTGDTATNSGNGLTVSHYLKVDGKIDLDGESQLIQTLDSDLDIASIGTLERDQQGTQDLYTYNYWSSPVGVSNTTSNNNCYTVPQIFNDGTDSTSPLNINFITNGFDGTPSGTGTPIGIADYWIWKYANLTSDFFNWQHVRSTGSMLVGEGFTMKGVMDTSNNLLLEQNYVIEGKPNNGAITLNINPASEYLVGNPYASAIDANRFILDNTNTTGVVLFWEHFGGGSHNTADYQGGYATYNLSGGVPAIQYNYETASNDPTGGNGTKTPGRYIPVAQGFFVTGTASGTINFNNSQRVFQKENANSVFLKNSNQSSNNPTLEIDNRLKIRLSFTTADFFNRQLLVTRDPNATELVDFGYDAENTEVFNTDVYWIIDTKKFTIQGTNVIEASTILPLGIKTAVSGINTFQIDALENAPSNLELFIFDTVTGSYHDIKNNPEFTIDLPAGEYLDRFELRFENGNSLSTEDFETQSGIQYYFTNNNETIVISNPEFHVIKNVELFNILGQSIVKFDAIETLSTIELKTNSIATGNYIIEITTDQGKLSKKVLVE